MAKQAITLNGSPPVGMTGVHVLVDGFNLQLDKGSGIKSYGSSLVRALGDLGARVSLLSSRAVVPRGKLPDEVSFFDSDRDSSPRIVRALRTLKTALGAVRPCEIDISKRVIAPDFPFGRVYNARDCFTLANRIFRATGMVTRYRLPRPVHVWHATYPLPIRIRSAPLITTIHDLIPLKLPYTTLDNKAFFFRVVARSIRDSALIVTVSENSKKDILEFFDVDPDKVVVTHQAVGDAVDPSVELSSESALRVHRLEAKGYILFVGNIEPKKNVGRLLRAFAAMDTDIPLVLVGKRAWLWKKELASSKALLSGRARPILRFLDYAPAAEMAALYRNALFLVFPSLYEGFGLPPVEAMRHGCPVIASGVSSLPEVCGEAASYVDPYSVEDIRAKMEMLVSDSLLRERMAADGIRQAARYSPENYAAKLRAAYARVL